MEKAEGPGRAQTSTLDTVLLFSLQEFLGEEGRQELERGRGLPLPLEVFVPKNGVPLGSLEGLSALAVPFLNGPTSLFHTQDIFKPLSLLALVRLEPRGLDFHRASSC